MHRKFSFLVLAVFAMSLLYLMSDFAEAKRMGGGRSFGSSPSYQRSAPQPTSPQRNTTQPAQNQPAPQAPGRPWGGMLGGFLMGGLLGSLLFGGMHGLTGPGMLDILLVGGLIFFLVRFLRARRMAAETAGQAPFSATFQDAHPQDGLGSSGYASAPQPFPSAPVVPIPPGFDHKEFLKGAKTIYARLQRSWDKRDLEDIRQFTAPDVYKEIVRQAEEDPLPGKTEILRVNAKVLEVKTEGDETVASVLYDVLMRESQDETVAREVSEVWHFRCDETAPGSFWVLEGIQQVEG